MKLAYSAADTGALCKCQGCAVVHTALVWLVSFQRIVHVGSARHEAPSRQSEVDYSIGCPPIQLCGMFSLIISQNCQQATHFGGFLTG